MSEYGVSEHTKEIAKGSLWGFAGKITFNIISFFYVIVVASAVTQDDLGLFYLTLSIVTILMLFNSLGMNAAIVRYIPFFEGTGNRKKIKTLLERSYIISSITSIALMFCLWLASDFIGQLYQNPLLPETIRMLSLVLVMDSLFKLNTAYLRARSDIRGMQLNVNLWNFLKLAITFALFHFYGASVVTIIAAYIISYVIATAYSFVNVALNSKTLPKKSESLEWKQIFYEILPFGVMLGLMTSLGSIVISIDSVLIGYLSSPSEATVLVAIYSVATALAMLAFIFPNSIAIIFLPVMSKLYGKKNLPEMRAVTETAERWLLFITVPIASILIAFAPEMLGTFYGPQYAAGALVMSIIVVAIVIKSIAAVLSLILTSMKVVKLQLKILLSLTGVQIILDIIFISYIGMMGAAITFLARSILMLLLFVYYSKKFSGFEFSSGLYKLMAASAVFMGIVWLIKPIAPLELLPGGEELGLGFYLAKVLYLIYIAVFASISFFALMLVSLLLKCFRTEDIGIMKKVMEKAHVPAWIIEKIEEKISYGVGS